ncbi:O-antigen ligase family protein [Planococcus wigleyi]|uniref:O-antigen ligase domain-containing protein n=1 Tax=Planococcus wigleyi TaxID=2762216 RepID=A0ABR8WA98_9BACL|nr:hypothetical protein [Planococcus wigleyi]MBD8013897.1 hypothetical protein [Planococcus wigleyi]
MKIVFVSLLLVLFFFSSYRMVGENVAVGAYGAYATYLLIITALLLFKVKKVEFNKSLLILAGLFSFTAMMSAFFNSEIGLLVQSVIFFCLFLSTTVLLQTYFKGTLGKMIVLTLVIAHVPLVLIPLLTGGMVMFPYRGIFDNPNSFGMVTATVFSVLLGALLSKIDRVVFYKEKPSKLNILIFFALAVSSFSLIVISASRTSFTTAIISTFAGLAVMFLFSIKHRRVLKMTYKLVLSLPFVAVFYFLINKVIPVNLYVQAVIFSKFERKSGDLLDGRTRVWIETIRDANPFGHGEQYFERQIGLGAHNTFIYIIGVYGWIPSILFISFFIAALYYCIRFVLNSDYEYKYLPLITLITFLGLSMAENQMFKIAMIVAFACLGLAANNKKIILTKSAKDHTVR